MQALSLIDVSMNVKDRVHGHAKGEVRSDSVFLSAPLVSRGPLPPVHDTDCDDSDNVKMVQEVVMRNSKAVQLCKILAEKQPGSHGLGLLPAESITSITENFKGAAPIYNSNMDNSVFLHPSFSLVATVDQQQHAVRKVPTGFKVGNITLREGRRADLDLITRSNGLPIQGSPDVSDEEQESDESEEADAHGSGSESDVDAPVDEVVQRVADTFEQCNMLQSQCNAAVLHKDLDRFKKQHPGEPEAEAVRHAMKHVLPATIPGYPALWQYNALQDLLAMVDANGMPDLFWTVELSLKEGARRGLLPSLIVPSVKHSMYASAADGSAACHPSLAAAGLTAHLTAAGVPTLSPPRRLSEEEAGHNLAQVPT
ncbi:hypothetical protein CEUSTIGMA_g6248.t1 [Chlamydomonas eustigma]|uniref:Uncharacterized protein n=1 Tax=Chlamydomonas eustigma TaxID=1157962 RepID=A0A250X6V2_9CHLO|nr:hypothetical protein CEUSTIGMA_g6248.t1 [Chlamydomonas eustigma]|eukprot:GAX78811.1 hypothetical protein CEUSTIGMA_g6248.t1 [Chlamydomonas eustigma]